MLHNAFIGFIQKWRMQLHKLTHKQHTIETNKMKVELTDVPWKLAFKVLNSYLQRCYATHRRHLLKY